MSVYLLLALLRATTSHDHVVGIAVRVAGAAFLLAPRRDRVTTTGGLALATTVRVVDRVHNHTTHGRAPALPAHTTSLAPTDVDLVSVADLTNSCTAADVHAADFGRRHTQNCVVAFLTQQLDGRTCGTSQLCACARLELHSVDGRTGRDVAQRQVVANLDVRVRASLDDGALLQALRGDDVALLTVVVVQQCDVRGAVRVVLDVSNLCQHAVLVGAAEVDHTVATLVAAAAVTSGDVAVGVTATLLRERAQQRLFRGRTSDLVERGHGAGTATRSCRLVLTNSHSGSFSIVSSASRGLRGRTAEDVDGVAALAESDVGALGVLTLTETGAGALALALTVDGVHRSDVDAENLFHGNLDLGLVRGRGHVEGVRVLLHQAVALLREHRGDDDVARVSDLCHLLLLLRSGGNSCAAVDEGVECLDREHNVISVEDVVGVQLSRLNDLDARQVPCGETGILIITTDHQQDRLAVGEALDECTSGLRRRGLARDEILHDVDALVLRTVGQSAGEGSLDHLLWGALCVGTRLRTMHNATTGVVRSTDRTLTGATGALLAERLLAAAGNHAAGLRCVGALALSSKLCIHNLVHECHGYLAVEVLGRQVDGTLGSSVCGVDVKRQLRHA